MNLINFLIEVSTFKGFRMARNDKDAQRDEKVIDGEWGIHFSDKSLPQERFDPFHFYIDQEGTQIGHRTIFSPIRLQRPFEFTHVKHSKQKRDHTHFSDTFCELVKGKLPAIVITKDNLLVNDLFSLKSRAENLSSSTVFTAINLYPPISRIIKNRNLNYRLTLKESMNYPTISSSNNLHVSTFFNIGLKAGASISHLHGQTILRFNQEGIGAKQNSFIISSKQNENNCKKCQLWVDIDDSASLQGLSLKGRLIFRNAHWIAILAYAPMRDAQIRLIPRRHITNIWSMNDDELFSLALILINSNKQLTSFIKKDGKRYQLSIDRNIIINQHYSAKERHFHMFIDILPVQQTGGAELFDDQKFSMIYPEEIARKMILNN